MKHLKHASETLAKTHQKHLKIIVKHTQHPYKNTYNICMKHLQHPNKHTLFGKKTPMKHWEQKLATYVYNYYSMCNIPINFCNIRMKHLQHTSETSETLETYSCNMRFQRNISLFRNGGSSARRVHQCRTRRSGREGHDRFGREGRRGSTRSRRPRWITSSTG